jgi:23S rRNA (uracil1939-C5)-methyltransferase
MEQTPIGDLRVPVRGFFQVNVPVANMVLERVMALLTEINPSRVVDLYCGSGVFTLAASRCGVEWSVGVDTSHSGIRAAHRNAVKLGLEGLEFISGPVENALHEVLPIEAMPTTTVIVDPPRRGLSKRVIDGLIQAKPANIIYVSCAADTLARDIALFAATGYTLRQAQLFDMFPRTALFETLAWMSTADDGSDL